VRPQEAERVVGQSEFRNGGKKALSLLPGNYSPSLYDYDLAVMPHKSDPCCRDNRDITSDAISQCVDFCSTFVWTKNCSTAAVKFDVYYALSTREHIKVLSARDRTAMFDAVEKNLRHEPAREPAIGSDFATILMRAMNSELDWKPS
jgi:hypothetical protein